jgi:hypothetical protein
MEQFICRTSICATNHLAFSEDLLETQGFLLLEVLFEIYNLPFKGFLFIFCLGFGQLS